MPALLRWKPGQFSAAVAAIKEKGVLSGKRVERTERGAPGEFEWLEDLSADELKAFWLRQAKP
jgi:hypothetical protein